MFWFVKAWMAGLGWRAPRLTPGWFETSPYEGIVAGARDHAVTGDGCWWGRTVVGVAAPDPWVPAYAGTTVGG